MYKVVAKFDAFCDFSVDEVGFTNNNIVILNKIGVTDAELIEYMKCAVYNRLDYSYGNNNVSIYIPIRNIHEIVCEE